MLGFIFLITLAVTFLALSGIYFCISTLANYSGTSMGNEASGFYQLFLMLTLVFIILAIMLWIWVIRLLKK